MKPQSSLPILSTALAAASLLLLPLHSTQAASSIWSSTAPDGAWETGSNWSAGSPGATSGSTSPDVATFNNASTTLSIVPDANRNIAGLSFDTNAGNYVIGSSGGNTLTLSSGGTAQILSTLAGSSKTMSINAPLSLAGNYTIQNSNATTTNLLNVGGSIGGLSGTVTLTLSGSNTGNNTITGAIGNGSATALNLTKSGTGTWLLSGSNNYTGTTTVNQGTLNFATGSLGSGGGITVNGGTLAWAAGNTTDISSRTVTIGSSGGTFNISGSTTFANSIGNSGTGAFTKTGGGILTLSAAAGWTGANNINGGTMILSNSNQLSSGSISFGGGALQMTGTHAFANTVTLNSNTTFQSSGSGNSVTFNGTTTNSSANRTITNNISGSLNFGNINLSESAATGRTLTFQGNATSSTNVTGTIANAASAGAGVGGITVNPTAGGIVTFSGNNTYTGKTAIQNGTLSVGSLNNVSGGSASSNLGAPTTVANGTIDLGAAGNTGTLRYTGAGQTTDRVINLVGSTGGGNVQNNGTGALVITSDLTVTAAGSKTLTLSGSHTGNNTFQGAIVNGSGTVSVSKAETGKWVLTGTNTYTGTTTIASNGGTFLINGTHTGGGAYTVNSGGTLGGSGSITTANANVTVSAGGKLAPGADTPAALTINSGTAGLNVSGAVTAGNSQSMLFTLGAVAGSDQLILSGGTLNIGSGVLEFDDFSFDTVAGFGSGAYTLFDTTSTITGTFGTNLTGTIAGMDATIAFANGGQDIVLTVVPEPQSTTLLLLGLGLFSCVLRRRSYGSRISC